MQWRRKRRVLYVIGSAHHALMIKQYRLSSLVGDGSANEEEIESPTPPPQVQKPRPRPRRIPQPLVVTEKKTFNEGELSTLFILIINLFVT